MKKLLLPFLSILLFTACKKQITNEKVQKAPEQTSGVTAKGGANKIDVCHLEGNGSYHTINISVNALPAHLAHGDIVPDADGDGYTKVNPCSNGSQNDCNDNNAAINPGATEICGNNIDDNCNGQVDENCFVIGADYQGGKIAYILQPGDPGYLPGETHGLIAAAFDQSTGSEWGCTGTTLPGADGTALGTGNQNTIDIMAGCATAGIAARLCSDLVLNGYSDWYLPSKDELNILYINKAYIGGFFSNYFWSSSEFDYDIAWYQSFLTGYQGLLLKHDNWHVRAVRAF